LTSHAPRLGFRPRLVSDHPTGVVLLLHGGREFSTERVRRTNLPAARMRPFATAILRRAMPGPIVVGRLAYRMRGWNEPDTSLRQDQNQGPDPDPVVDARWALERIRRRFGPVPVLLVGHSMGGRVALRVAGDESVFAVVALAPWLRRGEPIEQLRGRDLLIAHAPDDHVTDPVASRAYARAAEPIARQVEYRVMPRGRHNMLRGAADWHRLVADFAFAQFSAVLAARSSAD
jgi:dienelactone hydrolase